MIVENLYYDYLTITYLNPFLQRSLSVQSTGKTGSRVQTLAGVQGAAPLPNSSFVLTSVTVCPQSFVRIIMSIKTNALRMWRKGMLLRKIATRMQLVHELRDMHLRAMLHRVSDF